MENHIQTWKQTWRFFAIVSGKAVRRRVTLRTADIYFRFEDLNLVEYSEI